MSLTLPNEPPHWQDQHSGPLDPALLTARDAYMTGFSRMPAWAQFALDLRNRVVSLFGLKTEGPAGSGLMTSLPVIEDTVDRYRVGLADKHLTFTLLTERDDARVRITTSIWFNHWSGRLYLALVLVPHKLIVRQIIRRLA